MRRWPRAVPLVAVGLSITLVACGSPSPEVVVTGPNGEVDCRDVITRDVAAALSWDTAANFHDPEVKNGRCELRYPGLGTVTVGSLDGEESPQERYDEACGRLDVDAELTTDVAGAGHGCASGLDPAVQTGVLALVLLTTDDVVLHIRVDATAPLTPARQRSGLRELARTAQQAW